ncbi:MAG: 2-oxoacid:ferredoxin oxidoreductase subunit beta, partial [Planctomycetota bacterium]
MSNPPTVKLQVPTQLPMQKKDFVSDQEVRWCPGCGDYSILAQVQGVMPKLGISREKTVFVSGIGCSSRFPYYMNTYGFHTIHGRAPTIATGIKCANPDLDVWVITGDGDALSIGGNHFLHVLRRNVSLKLMLFNNRIYGLTKGQYSPTSELGKKTKSTPYGTIEHPLNPISLAIAAGSTFVARSIDIDVKHLSETIEVAAKHKGTAFMEIYQNCNIFNDKAFSHFTERDVRQDRVLYLEHGKPLLFGKDRKKGIRIKGYHPEVVEIGKDGVTEADMVVHNAHEPSPHYSYLLSQLNYPEFPVPVGVFRAV